MTPKLPFKVGEYADEIVDADGKLVLQMAGGRWIDKSKIVYMTSDEVALRDFVIEACNKFSQSSGADATLPQQLGRTKAVDASPVADSTVRVVCRANPPQSNSFDGSTITSLEKLVEQAEAK